MKTKIGTQKCSAMSKINIQFLQKVFSRIIDKLEYENVTSIQIEDDLYNKIPAHNWSILNKPEEVVVIGSLQDDIDSLWKLVTDNERPCTYVDFDRFASVLHAISEIRNPVEGD